MKGSAGGESVSKNHNVIIARSVIYHSRRIFQYASSLRACPYKWSFGEMYPRILDGVLPLLLWRINLFYHGFFTCFVAFRSFQLFLNSASLLQKVFIFFQSSSMLLSFCLQIPMIFYWRQNLILMKHSLLEFQSFERFSGFHQVAQNSQLMKIYELALPIAEIGLSGATMMIAASIIILPGSPMSILSFLDEAYPAFTQYFLSTGFGMIFAKLFDAALVAHAFHLAVRVALLHFVSISLYIVPSIMVLKRMSNTERTEMTPLTLRIYTELKCLNNQYNSVFSLMLSGVQSTVTVMVVVGVYCGVRMGGTFGAATAAVGFLGLAVVTTAYSIYAAVAESSNAFMEHCNYKSPHSALVDKKSFASLQQHRIYVGTLFYVDKAMLVTMCQVAFDNILNALLLGRAD